MAMDTYKQLKDQIARLEKQAEKAKKAETKDVIQQIVDLMSKHELSIADIRSVLPGSKRGRRAGKGAGSAKSKPRRMKTGAKPKPKYRSPENRKDTWSGRGRMPRWAREWVESGKALDELALK